MNSLAFVPNEFEYLISLEILKLQANRILSLPPSIGNCSKLKFLDVSCNALSTLPESFGSLTLLEYCDIYKNNISLSKRCLSSLSSLKFLRGSSNTIQAIHSDISGCVQLEKLLLDNNHIDRISPEIGLLTRLEELDLRNNRLKEVLPEIGACKSLIKLNLSHNQLHGRFVETIALLSNLQDLDISHNNLTDVPPNIIGLVHLKDLNVSNNQLKELPTTLSCLQQLRSLKVASNRIPRFPMFVSNLKKLAELDLSENLIELLPREIDVFTNLRLLNLSNNQLRALPLEFISVLETVPEVMIEGNPWTLYPPSWGKLWQNKHAADGAENGYTLSKVLQFLYNMQRFYTHAKDIWEEIGHLFYAQKLSFDDFLTELRKRIDLDCSGDILPFIKVVFFGSRESGVFPLWYELSASYTDAMVSRKQEDGIRREYQVRRSKQEFTEKMDISHEAYDLALARRAKRREQVADEHRTIEEHFSESLMKATKEKVKEVYSFLAERELDVVKQRHEDDVEERLRLIQESNKRLTENRSKNEK